MDKSATEIKIDWASQDTNENANIKTMNMEQKNIIETLEGILNFFKSAQIENEEALVFIKKPLEELESCLKYIPIGPSFSLLPAEIKTNILNYLCHTNACTAASVCQHWKDILESRFTGKTFCLGKRYCHFLRDDRRCDKCSKDSKCSDPKVMLKALNDHKLDVHLIVREPIKEEVDSKLVAAGLTSVSSFYLYGNCTCEVSYDSDMSHDSHGNIHLDYERVTNPLSLDQLEDTFKEMEKNEKIMEFMGLHELDLSELNQDRLAHSLVNKVKHLSLRGSGNTHGDMLNFKVFIRKLSEKSSEFTLNHLSLSRLKLPNELAREIGNALCNVEYVEWHDSVPLKLRTMKQLFQNVLTRPVQIKTFINWRTFDCRKLISPEDLKRFLNRMTDVRMQVKITPEQLKAAQSVPDVSAWYYFLGGYSIIEKDL